MKNVKRVSIPVMASAMGVFAVAGAAADTSTGTKSPGGVSPTAAPAGAAAAEQQRNLSQKQGDKAIDKDALAAIEEAQNAVNALANAKSDVALAAIERATGKITVLTAREPSAGLIPVKTEVSIVDVAPQDRAVVDAIRSAASNAMSSSDYPKARVLLDQLASEIHVKTYNLPLATYPLAMQAAARLIDQKKNEAAKQALLIALNTLVVTDQLLPLSLIEAQASIKEAQSKRDQDKAAARVLLSTAQQDLDRAKQLGYANKDLEYASLNQSLSDLNKQLAGTDNTSSAFTTLRAKMAAFYDRITQVGAAPATPATAATPPK